MQARWLELAANAAGRSSLQHACTACGTGRVTARHTHTAALWSNSKQLCVATLTVSLRQLCCTRMGRWAWRLAGPGVCLALGPQGSGRQRSATGDGP